MAIDDDYATPSSGSWQDRVQWLPGTGVAATPHRLVVRGTGEDAARVVRLIGGNAEVTADDTIPEPPDRDPALGQLAQSADHHVIEGDFDLVEIAELLAEEQVQLQPDHVLFSGSAHGSPNLHRLMSAGLSGSPFSGNPFSGNPLSGNPFSGNPYSGNPFSGNPFSGNPFSGNPFSGNPFSGNPFSGNPFSGNPFSGNPFSGNPFSGNPAGGYPFALPGTAPDEFALTGRGRSTARPAEEPVLAGDAVLDGHPAVAVFDVPVPVDHSAIRPAFLERVIAFPGDPVLRGPLPDGLKLDPDHIAIGSDGRPHWVPGHHDQDDDGYLDRQAGHGMFVAGRILQVDPGCTLEIRHAVTNIGDAAEKNLFDLVVAAAGRIDLLNLSLGGYAVDDMPLLRRAVRHFQRTPGPASLRAENLGKPAHLHGGVIVAAAGNDGTWAPTYPACLPGVVGVAALGPDGVAGFSNWGPSVRACASGVDVVSSFFTGVKAAPDSHLTFEGGARWSGTSFAAPLVTGRLSRLVREKGLLPKEAVKRLLDGPDLARLPFMGTIVTA